MQIGLFDHVEHGKRPLATLFDERLAFVRAAEEAGIYCLHVAEHHATPLNMVPVPGVYLGAVARATQRMRLGPLVYLLPLYSPLRLIEEICILDHLSHGRLEIGIGRGVSPFELKYHKIDHDESMCPSPCARCSSRIPPSGTALPTRPAPPGRGNTGCIS
jgi:alkanesulfonate monooxygenase SsuD/methylene tetrahydromethanopterin reductase-like flavin-dependent oxidoreductase (luciferase family)